MGRVRCSPYIVSSLPQIAYICQRSPNPFCFDPPKVEPGKPPLERALAPTFSSMCSIHLISRSIIPGSWPPDGRCLPCSGLSGRALGLSPNSSHTCYKLISSKTNLSLKCSFRKVSCNASPNNYRRNPDSNKRKFSRNRNNRHNEDRDSYDDLEGPNATLSSKNGPFFPISSNQRSHGTATPGPREKEIVELFKKVQAQLRERAALKEEKKEVETSQGKSKQSETVDSLLKLLRKHSVQQSKKTTFSGNDRDFNLDQQDQADPSLEPADNSKGDEIQETIRQTLTRPKSSFRKRSPVPEIKFQPIYSEESFNSISHKNLEKVSMMSSLEPESEEEEALNESDSDESDVDEISKLYEEDDCEILQGEENNRVEAGDLSGKKLAELRALAKSRGLKGYSKLKKSELIELLSE